ncbi:FR47-like protein [Actinomycetospora succinea]|uniref:FR47-like protein n=1 Tax=Actinomycetospora succinea TaxID=663603 RepID=A0A4R6V930_9PSEU|nr:GNAT family N-acetyltransferase [Actinomycetospora succinea]TDQ55699.1 FR47-like protein [Actinomycetospora succinea]
MTAAPARASVVDLTPDDLAARLDEALTVYVRAMGYPAGTVRQRRPMWVEHSRRAGWHAAAAIGPDRSLWGIAYGYPGARGQWWYEEVRRGLLASGAAGRELAETVLGDYFELTELHVRPDVQGGGVGEALARRLLAHPADRHVLLSTPEADNPTRAWSLYRRLGFRDVLRHHRFTSDPRPFAVLGRPLPLDPPETPGTRDAPPGRA